ncbi:MAG: hypothetical protein IIA87_04630 [Nanoarchaeota archaeon]|nr:hypothetical protein [Nanoarchaeota archaeon]
MPVIRIPDFSDPYCWNLFSLNRFVIILAILIGLIYLVNKYTTGKKESKKWIIITNIILVVIAIIVAIFFSIIARVCT